MDDLSAKEVFAINPRRMHLAVFVLIVFVSIFGTALPGLAKVKYVTTTYTVQSGDSLFKIAQSHGVSVADLQSINKLKSTTLYVGQKLQIPSGGTTAPSAPSGDQTTYTVRSGDSFYLISQRFGVTVSALQEINNVRTTYLEVGQVIKIPAKESSPTSPTPTPESGLVFPEGTQTYTVRPGDSLFVIAQRFGTSVLKLQRANNLGGTYLEVGQQILVPKTLTAPAPSPAPGDGTSSGTRYTVRAGDTLFLISQKFGVTVTALRQANNLSSDYLNIGQVLNIPAAPSAPGPIVIKPGIISLTSAERDLLARLVSAESAGEPYEGQVAVAATVIRRVLDPRYPNNIRDVIYQVYNGLYQYEPVLNGHINNPATATAFRAVDDALAGQDPSNGANGFYNPVTAVGSWVRSQPVTATIANHVFFRS